MCFVEKLQRINQEFLLRQRSFQILYLWKTSDRELTFDSQCYQVEDLRSLITTLILTTVLRAALRDRVRARGPFDAVPEAAGAELRGRRRRAGHGAAIQRQCQEPQTAGEYAN